MLFELLEPVSILLNDEQLNSIVLATACDSSLGTLSLPRNMYVYTTHLLPCALEIITSVEKSPKECITYHILFSV